MDIHVLTPFSRPANIPALLSILEPARVTWHLIAHAPEAIPPLPVWAHIYDCGKELGQTHPDGPWDKCYWKFNWWIQTQKIDDTARYCFLCDDDGFEPGYYDRIREAGNIPVVVTAMHRGYRQPHGSPHPAGELKSSAANMRQCHVGLEQFSVIGEVLRQMRFANHGWADGRMAEWLVAHYPVVYLPIVFAWFNWLEPGRWDSGK